MKKLLYIASFLALTFTACDPMEDTYDELDGLREPYTQDIELTLGAEDYAAIGGDAAKYKSFSKYDLAADNLPDYFADKYATLETGSSVMVTYAYYRGGLDYLYDYLDYLEELDAITAYTLSTADYDSMGTDSGEPGKYNNFSDDAPAADYLPDFLLGKYPDAADGDELAVTYKYYDGSVSEITEFWAFDGSVWAKTSKSAPEVPEDVTIYELESADYDSMGAPGKYNNFSGSDAPENYLPTFLGIKFAYAVEGEKVAVLYKYYAGGGVTETRAKEYTLTDGVWVEYQSTISMTEQYILTADGWVFDPTIVFTMVSDDYQMIVDYSVANNGVTSKYPDSEYYYGASAKYSNFDLRLKNRNTEDYPMPEFDGLSDEDAIALTMERMKEGVAALLTVKYPNAVTQVSGIDVFYLVDVKAYKEDLTDGYYTLKFQCTKSGPNPEFTYVEGLPE